jgi:hypothetical protein
VDTITHLLEGDDRVLALVVEEFEHIDLAAVGQQILVLRKVPLRGAGADDECHHD